jgi:hypothetical protein
MNASLHPLFAALLCGVVLSGCSKPESATASSAEVAGPTDDPCALVTDGEVRNAFPGAKAGKRDHSLDQHNIATCTWEATAAMVVVQLYDSKDSVENELRGRMLGSLDPLNPAARDKVRYDAMTALGNEAMVVVEKADPQQGILGDVAVLGMRRGENLAIIFTSTFVDGDRAATIEALKKLGASAAPRL